MRAIVPAGTVALLHLSASTAVHDCPGPATSNDRDAAGLVGINTSLVITFSYALSSLTAALAGVLVAPVTLTGATMARRSV